MLLIKSTFGTQRNEMRNKTMLRFLFKSQLSDRNALPIYRALKTPVVCIWRENVKIGCSYMRSQLLARAVFDLYIYSIYDAILNADTTGRWECKVCNSTAIIILDKIVDANIWKHGYKKVGGPQLENSFKWLNSLLYMSDCINWIKTR